jgi:predicted ATPase with chaperone activity
MTKFTIPKKNKPDKDENFIKFEIPTDLIQSICGQEKVKRAIEISIAGEYSLCIYGPSGQGKTQLLTAYREMYMKIYRRKVPYPLYDIDGHPTEKDATLYVKVDKLPYSTINKGFNGLTSKEIVSKINRRLLTTDLFITPDFWDILGQTYSRDALTPKQVFSALKVARTIANLEQSEIITRTHFKESLVLVTFPQLKAEKEPAKEIINSDSNLC